MNLMLSFGFIFIFVCIGVVLYLHKKSLKEPFVDLDFTLEEQIIRVYQEVLQRMPTSSELVEHTRSITDNTLTIQGLEQKLIDSDEYQRVIKMQTNELAPELRKMISDRALMDMVSTIYQQERKSKIPENMVLPLKDIYVYLDYNEYALRAMLRTQTYPRFQEDVLATQDLDKTKLMEIFNRYYKKEKLMDEGKKIAEAMLAAQSGTGKKNLSGTGAGSGNAPKPTPSSASLQTSCSVSDKDSNMDPMLQNILKCAANVFDKDQAARILNDQSNMVKFPVRTHFGEMVLRPEQAWTVPNKQVPVCTTLGARPMVQPVMTNSKLLLGTSLEDSKDTQVGSIMPKFEYNEYVNIPRGLAEQATPPSTCSQTKNAPKA